MKELIIREANHYDKIQVVELTKLWETEKITYGFVADDYDYIADTLCFVAILNDQVIGFILGNIQNAKNMGSIIPDETSYFELEEIYVIPEHRSSGIGTMLFNWLELFLKSCQVTNIVLSTATKNYQKILEFYVRKLNMKVWSIRLFKNINE
jgi:ribosomal protein S18 acetylase RimI-like enzyme